MTEAEKRLHRCCFTGHRPEKLREPEAKVKQWLEEQIDDAIRQGYVTFITGMCMGVDLWAAEIVIDRRETNKDLHLIAALPYPRFSDRWNYEWQEIYKNVWNKADLHIDVSRTFSKDCFQRRNEWMVDHSNLVIACYNGTPGGTFNTIRYAKMKGVEVHISADSEYGAD